MKMTPYEKMSKKQRKELNSRRRNTWDIKPTTRICPSRNGKQFQKGARTVAKAALKCGLHFYQEVNPINAIYHPTRGLLLR